MIWTAWPGPDRERPATPPRGTSPDDLEADRRRRHVVGPQRVAVHRRAVEGRHVDVGADVLAPARARGRPRAPPPRRAARASRAGRSRGPPRRGSWPAPDCSRGQVLATRAARGRDAWLGWALRRCAWSRQWRGRTASVVMIDQRRLPTEEIFVRCRDHHEVAAAIKDMAIRGAPAIGVAAALGLALGVAHEPERGRRPARRVERHLRGRWPRRRPDRGQPLLGHRADAPALRRAGRDGRRDAPRTPCSTRRWRSSAEDVAACRRMGDLGAELLPAGGAGAHPLQRRRPGHRRLRHRPRRRALGRAARQAEGASSPTRPGPACRARASPPGSCSRTGSRPR